MKRMWSVVLMLVILFVATACVQLDRPSPPTETVAPLAPTTTEISAQTTATALANTWREDLRSWLTPQLNQVFSYVGGGQTGSVLLAAIETTEDDLVCHLEGEFYDRQHNLLDYYDGVYLLQKNQLSQVYAADASDDATAYQTIWLKAPLAEGESWSTSYYDVVEGFVDAQVAIESLTAEAVAVRLTITDSALAATDRYSVVKQFSAALPLGSALYYRGQALQFSESHLYRQDDADELLARHFSDVDYISDLFEDDQVAQLYQLGAYKANVRSAADDAGVAQLLTDYLMRQREPKRLDYVQEAFSYALKRVRQPQLISTAFADWAQRGGESAKAKHCVDRYADYLNRCFSKAYRQAAGDFDCYFSGQPYVPDAGDFTGSKYFSKAYIDSDLFVNMIVDGAYYYDVIYGAARDSFVDQIEADRQTKAFLKLTELLERERLEVIFAGNQGVEAESGEALDLATTHFVDLLAQSDALYDELDEAYRLAAKTYMNEILQSVFRHDEYPEKYCAGTGLNDGDGIVPAGSYGRAAYTEMAAEPFVASLKTYLNDHPKSYYSTALGNLLAALDKYDQYYNAELDDLIAQLYDYQNPFGFALAQSAQTLMADLTNYYDDLAVKIEDRTKRGDVVVVDTVKALIDAIEPGATIVLEPKTYLFRQSDGDYQGPYGGLVDGHLTIFDVDGLTIKSRAGLAQFIAEGGENAVDLYNCSNLKLSGLRIGHLAVDDSHASALYMGHCRKVIVTNCILFGPAQTALKVEYGSDILLKRCLASAVRDYACSVTESDNVTFNRLFFRDNQAAIVALSGSSSLTMKNCISQANASHSDNLIEVYDDSILRLSDNDFREDVPLIYSNEDAVIIQ